MSLGKNKLQSGAGFHQNEVRCQPVWVPGVLRAPPQQAIIVSLVTQPLDGTTPLSSAFHCVDAIIQSPTSDVIVLWATVQLYCLIHMTVSPRSRSNDV